MDFFISSVITLALVMDGFGNIPLFIAALKKVTPERRKIVLLRELGIALLIMVAFLFLGKWFLQAFGVRQFSLSIAGGIILFIISVRLVFGGEEEAKTDPKEDEPFVVPLAIPLVAGPAALSMVMILSAQSPNLLGKRGLVAIERLTGMILVLMSVDMVMGGIAEFIKLGNV